MKLPLQTPLGVKREWFTYLKNPVMVGTFAFVLDKKENTWKRGIVDDMINWGDVDKIAQKYNGLILLIFVVNVGIPWWWLII